MPLSAQTGSCTDLFALIVVAAAWLNHKRFLEALAVSGLVILLIDVISQARGFGVGENGAIVHRLVWWDGLLLTMPVRAFPPCVYRFARLQLARAWRMDASHPLLIAASAVDSPQSRR